MILRALLVASMVLLSLAVVHPAAGVAVADVRGPTAIRGDVGPTGLILGYDSSGEPVYNPGSAVTSGHGTPEDPYVIAGWHFVGAPAAVAGGGAFVDELSWFLFGQPGPDARDAGVALRIEGTTAHLLIVDNLIEGAMPFRVVDAQNVVIEGNTIVAGSQAAEEVREIDEEVGNDAPFWLSASQFLPAASGVEILGGANIVVRSNAVRGALVTIQVDGTEGIVIDQNTVDVARVAWEPIGIHIIRGQDVVVSRNAFEGDWHDFDYLIQVEVSDNVELFGHDTPTAESGTIDLTDVRGARVHHNTHNFGFRIGPSSDVLVDHNRLTDSTRLAIPLYVGLSNGVRIEANEMLGRVEIVDSRAVVLVGNSLLPPASAQGGGTAVGFSESVADVSGNWWGCAEGPYLQGTPGSPAPGCPSVGTFLSTVTMTSWLTAPDPAAGNG